MLQSYCVLVLHLRRLQVRIIRVLRVVRMLTFFRELRDLSKLPGPLSIFTKYCWGDHLTGPFTEESCDVLASEMDCG